MNNILVAVWMVTYNQEQFIEQAILSIINQKTNFNYKLFIGEDCSKDGTREICMALKNKYPNKINLFLNEKNLGAMNNAINIYNACFNSGSKYIALCEGDDYWTDPLKLQKQVDFLEANPEYVACYNGCKHVDENNIVTKESRYKTYHDQDADKLLTAEGAMITNSVMFRNIIKEFPKDFMNVPSGDTYLYHLLGFYGAGKFLSDIKYSAYRIHSGGVWSGINLHKRLNNTITTMSAIRKNINQNYGSDSDYLKRVNINTVHNLNNYLLNALQDKEFLLYFKMIKDIIKQNSFSRISILKNHFSVLFNIILKKK